MKNKNNINVAKAISALSKTHKIKRNKIKRLADKKGGKKKKKISKKALVEVGLKSDKKKPKINVESTANDSLVKLTNISYKGAPVNSTPNLLKQQKKVEGDKTPSSFIRRMKDKLKGARFRFVIVKYNFLNLLIYYLGINKYENQINITFKFNVQVFE